MSKQQLGIRALRRELSGIVKSVEQSGRPVTVTSRGLPQVAIVPVAQDDALLSNVPKRKRHATGGPTVQIIATLSLKGGVGKTTIAMHLATVIAEQQALVTVLDADEEVSALRWQQHALADGIQLPFQVVAADRNSLMRQARDLARAGHVVVIDTPPNNREVLKTAAMIADVVLVPVLPTGLDVDRLGTTLDLLRDLESALDDFNYAVVLNRYDARKGMGKEANVALDSLPRLNTVIRSLASYEKAFGHVPSELVQFRDIWNELTGGTVSSEVRP